MSHILNETRRMLIFLIASVFIGTILMVAVYALPSERMYSNVNGVAEMYFTEPQPRWATGWHTALDNFTDSIMLMTAIHPTSGSIVFDAMANARWDHYNAIVQILPKAKSSN